MKILHFSDSHGTHHQYDLNFFKDFDVIVFSGDESNSKLWFKNISEFIDFVDWYSRIDCKYKIMIPGNHSTYIESFESDAKEICKGKGITLLINEAITIDGVVFYGTPNTIEFHNWAYNNQKERLKFIYDQIPENTNVLISHGPPLGYLDKLQTGESVGSPELLDRINELHKLKAVLFGHIHSNSRYNIKNYGIVIGKNGVVYSNGSCVVDSPQTYKLVNLGNLIEI